MQEMKTRNPAINNGKCRFENVGMQRKIVGTAATANWKCSDRKSGKKHIIMGNAAYKNDKCRK